MKKSFLHWGFTIFQGMIIFLLGVWQFAFPVKSLTVTGIVFLLAGIAGLAEWFLSRDFDRHTGDFLWGILTGICGIFVLFGVGEALQVFLSAFWMIISGIWLFARGQALQWISNLSWGITIMGCIIVIVGLLVAFNPQATANGILENLPYLFTGLAIFAIATLKKKIFQDW